MRAWAASDSRGRTGACFPESADGIANGRVGTLRAAVLVLGPADTLPGRPAVSCQRLRRGARPGGADGPGDAHGADP